MKEIANQIYYVGVNDRQKTLCGSEDFRQHQDVCYVVMISLNYRWFVLGERGRYIEHGRTSAQFLYGTDGTLAGSDGHL